MDVIEKTVKKNYVFQGKIISVRKDDAVLPDGKPCVREIVEHPGGTSILYVEEDNVLLVKQYRYAFQEVLYEIPAGKLNLGEDPKAAAIRELSEETGLEADDLDLLCEFYPTCGYCTEKIYVYQAVNVKKGKAHLDEGEFLNVVYLPLQKVWQMIQSGEIKDGKTVLAIQSYLLKNKKTVDFSL